MLFATSLNCPEFCLRRFLIFSTSQAFDSASYSFQCFRSLNSCMAHLLSRENCAFGRRLSDIIRGATRSENDRHLCLWDERTRRKFYPNVLHKTRHSIHYVVGEEQPNIKQVVTSAVFTLYARNAWDHDPPLATNRKRLALYFMSQDFLRKPELLTWCNRSKLC